MELKDNVLIQRKRLKLTQEDLAQKSGTSQQVIADIESGRTKRPRQLFAIATALGVDIGELMGEQARIAPPKPGGESQVFAVSGRDLPIYSAVEGGGGSMIISWEPVEWLVRPAPLSNVRGGYGIYVVGESMFPAFEPGDVALVNPHLPPGPNRDVVLFREKMDNANEGLIKRLVKITPGDWKVQQWNPQKSLDLNRKEWVQCQVVIGKYSR